MFAVLAMVMSFAGVAQAAGTAAAAPTAGTSDAGSAKPQLTANTKAPCNAKPKKGHAQCYAVVRTPANHEITPFAGPPGTALGPADIQDAYNLPIDQGAGQTVAIVDAGDDAGAEADLAVFRSQYGLPPCTTDNGCFRKVNQRGEQANYPPDRGWGVEISLDLDAVSAACPACHILLVEGDDATTGSLGTAVETAVELGAKYVSNSYGSNEYAAEGDNAHYWNHKGVAVTVSSGDTGNVVNSISANPNVVAVGGTRLTKDTSTSRGWTEKVWGTDQSGQNGAGSGCSLYEPKPDYQDGLDTNCDMRATADVSADADPQSGLAVYDSHDGRGWLQVGGTSLSSPLVAATYALAGQPTSGTYPGTYPYDPSRSAGLFDITEGEDSDCGNVLCTAGPGWDGPTGMGTPNGVAALRTGPHGDIAGTVTDADTGDPIATRATVSTPQGYQVSTGKDGEYDLIVAVGSYNVTASAFGYADKTVTGVAVTEGQTTTEDFVLATTARVTLSGTVSDGSGHDWPLPAKITVPGTPLTAIYSDPYTGRYTIQVPGQSSYTLHVAPVYPGYAARDVTVQVGASDLTQDLPVKVDSAYPAACDAPGYAISRTGGGYAGGIGEQFTGWSGTTPHDGWTIDNTTSNGWEFSPPGFPNETPGGTDGLVVASPVTHGGAGTSVDTSLVSPAFSLAGQASPQVTFAMSALAYATGSEHFSVDLSLDRGQTWQNVWKASRADFVRVPRKVVTIPVSQAAGKTSVRVRFHFTGAGFSGWEIDNVLVGEPVCKPVPGGLVAGQVSDANTGKPVDDATVAGSGEPAQSGSSVTGEPSLPGGFYWLFSPGSGSTRFTVHDDHGYVTSTGSVDVAADAVTRQDWALKAGRLTVTPGTVSATETLGQSMTRKVTFTNDGGAPLHVALGTQARGFTSAGPDGNRHPAAGSSSAANGSAPAPTEHGAPAGRAWKDIASYPTLVSENGAATDPLTGKVYSVSGLTVFGLTRDSFVYDPTAGRWSPIAPAAEAVGQPITAFLNGTLYMAGGYRSQNSFKSDTTAVAYAYTPGSDSWTQVASLPQPLGQSGVAVLGGKLYVVGGGKNRYNDAVDAVYRYDPVADVWTRLANYPIPIYGEACAGIDGQLVCAGGRGDGVVQSATYRYDPADNTWTRGADIPSDAGSGSAHMANAGANGRLQIAGGSTDNAYSPVKTSSAHEYDPVTNTWSTLPAPNGGNYVVSAGGACGFYRIGGALNAATPRTSSAEVLPGYDRCDGAGGTPWLPHDTTGLDLSPGQSVDVIVTLDSAQVDQPGTYTATLYAATDTPYPVQTTGVTMKADPPAGWHLLKGTVTDSSGHPLAAATITIRALTRRSTGQGTYAVRTDAAGHYQWWLPNLHRPLQVSVAKDGYQPQLKRVTLTSGTTMTVDVTLKGDPARSTVRGHDTPAAAAASPATSEATAKPSPARTKTETKAKANAGKPAVARACARPKRAGRAVCLVLVRTGTKEHQGLMPQAAPAGYGPADLQDAYDLPSATAGSGETVAIVDAFDNPNAEADLQTYREQYGLPPCTSDNGCFTKVNQRGEQGHYPPPDTGWGLEISLDIQMVSAVCPKCHILLVEADDNTRANLGKSVAEVVALGAKYVSNSYGGPEDPSDPTTFDKYFDHPGVVVTASSGDSGYGTNFPSASQYVTAVGGTSLTRDTNTTRGWTETVWDGAGSGCSQFEAKPAWQRDTGCGTRTVADVSAVADPNTGVAMYDSGRGWLQVGGTSVSSPIIASVYALAGTPAGDTYPAAYPYVHATGLNDVTSGTNGTCDPGYLCSGGPGYDGPTGLGTPDGVAAFEPVHFGTVAGTVTDADTGKPIGKATVTAGGLTATTDDSGRYALAAPVGSYDVTTRAFGYADKTVTGVTVTQGQTTTQDFALATVPSVTLSGTVSDGSGHKWPLPAKITIPGTPLKPFYSDPYTGHYSVQIPGQTSYTVHVAPVYPGYAARDVTVPVGSSDLTQDLPVTVDLGLGTCSAPGYGVSGLEEHFTGWSGTTPQDGWTIDNQTDNGWQFGSNGWAEADPRNHGRTSEDTTLVSPVVDLSGVSSTPHLTVFSQFWVWAGHGDATANIDLSLDGGTTWHQVEGTIPVGARHLDIPLPQAAGKSEVRVRFHYTGTGYTFWWLDDVVLTSCQAEAGGLVAGQVSDANTGTPLGDATVARADDPAQSGTSVAGDPALPDGFYWLFSASSGKTAFTVRDHHGYATATGAVDVAANAVTRQYWALKAGRLTVQEESASASETLGRSATRTVRFTNGGSAPLHVALGTQPGGFIPAGPDGNPQPAAGSSSAVNGSAPQSGGPSPDAAAASKRWKSIAPYPTPGSPTDIGIANSAVATDPRTGKVYSVGGTWNGHINIGSHWADPHASAYMYDPAANTWTPIAPAPQALRQSSAAFLNGTLYLVGGFNGGYFSNSPNPNHPTATVYAYTPGSDTWTQVASLPKPIAGMGTAVLDGKLYVIGGCQANSFHPAECKGTELRESRSVYRYDPAGDSWTQLADYPVAFGVAYAACAGIQGQVVCAGGTATSAATSDPLTSTYLYDPASDSWSQGAGMPYPAFMMASSGANGRLQVAGGVIGSLDGDEIANDSTDRVSEYDPATNTWTALPSLPAPQVGGGGGCGMYVIGGWGSLEPGDGATKTAEMLPGYSQCGGDAGWLSADPSGFDLNPGQSTTVTVTLDSAQVTQPGTYRATLYATAYTPYRVTTVPVTMRVNPPSSWGLLHGTVTKAGSGNPIAGATVQLCANYSPHRGTCGEKAFTVKTDVHGDYQLWLDVRYNRLGAVAAKDGYVQQVRAVRLRPGRANDAGFALPRFEPGPHALQERPHTRSHAAAGEAMPRQRPGPWPG